MTQRIRAHEVLREPSQAPPAQVWTRPSVRRVRRSSRPLLTVSPGREGRHGARGAATGPAGLRKQSWGWGHLERSSLNCSVLVLSVGTAGGKGEEVAPCQDPSLSPPTAGKSLSLSITLLRINFVEIKIGLGINSASRIFSGLWRPQRGQIPIPRAGCRLGFQGHQRRPNPLPAVTLSPLGTQHLVPGGGGNNSGPCPLWL